MSQLPDPGPYAHSDPHFPNDTTKWEPLFSSEEECQALKGIGNHCELCESLDPSHGHLNKVAWWAAKFASEMFKAGSEEANAAWEWGYLAGLWHDLGKFALEWQEYLVKATKGEATRGPDHSTAGAQHANERFGGISHLLGFIIAGHHGGLGDLISSNNGRPLIERLGDTKIHQWVAPEIITKRNSPPKPPCKIGKSELANFDRLLFSSLVDADFLATEAFMNPTQHRKRSDWPDNILEKLDQTLEKYLAQFEPEKSAINQKRYEILNDCISAATKQAGLFTLTVPTGGGKTLSSLAFAIKHAIEHKLKGVIYVIPYVSIIEQNAAEFKKVFSDLSKELGQEIVLEHHCNFDPESTDDFPVYKLGFENWDSPIVVTTNVQFFESLYANKSSKCRKLHNIARSVIVFDEAQSIPVEFLEPCLSVITDLTTNYGVSAVLCTATQPALSNQKDFTIGLNLTARNEIIGDPDSLFSFFRRVNIKNLGKISDVELKSRLLQCERVLCILNTKPHAETIFDMIGRDDPTNLHLSAQLCPEHRMAILNEVRRRESTGEPCRLVATTVVQAGVDLSFPIGYRSMTGLDSFAQAAGRCNRHDELAPAKGDMYFFTPDDQKVPGYIVQSTNATSQVLPDHDDQDLLGRSAIKQFFELYYWLEGEKKWDQHQIMECFDLQDRDPPFLFNYREAAKRFNLIPDIQKPVIIEPKDGLWNGLDKEKSKQIRDLLSKIRDCHKYQIPPPKDCHRLLQRYTVLVPAKNWNLMVGNGSLQLYCDDRFPILTHPENDYDPMTGVKLPDHPNNPYAFLI